MLPETKLLPFWPGWVYSPLDNLLTWALWGCHADAESDGETWLAKYTTDLGLWACTWATHPEPLGWQAWSTPPDFLLRGGQKLPVLTVCLVTRERYWNSFQRASIMPWIDLASGNTTAAWTYSSICYLCERDEVRLTGVTSRVAAEHVNQSPRPIVGICPLQRSNSSSSQFCSYLRIKYPLRDKMKMWDRQKF